MEFNICVIVERAYIHICVISDNNIFDECFICDPCGDGPTDCDDWGVQCNQPIAYNGEYNIEEDEFISILLQAVDPNNDLLSYQITQSPTNGTLSGQNEVYLYTPNNNFFGQDSIKFTASDLEWTSNEATIIIRAILAPERPLV